MRIGLTLVFMLFCSGLWAQTDDAKRLYQGYQDSIYQIRIIEKGSGNKASIGSGFLLGQQGHVVSNYHVVADAVNKPDRYLIEYLDARGQKGQLQLLTVDVVHDLALLKASDIQRSGFTLQQGTLAKGIRLFSLGNPHDLGMTVVEGTYNGLVDGSFYERILFSGSLNPGMSGGPTINREGEVIGVNVATAGNQISFLVPVDYLHALLSQANENEPISDWDALLEQQLQANQAQILDQLLKEPWKMEPLGDARVAAEIAQYVKCWGDTDDNEKYLYQVTHRVCQMEESIYVGGNFSTGVFRYEYQWYESNKLNLVQFYSQMEDGFYIDQANDAGEDNVTPYECNEQFVESVGKNWKAHLCVRRYKKYPALMDVSLSMASLLNKRTGLVANFSIAGVDQTNARRITQRFMESMQWN